MNEITITEAAARAAKLRESGERFTMLGIGPMSHNLLRAAFGLAAEKDFPLMLIASRNQVDSDALGGGYVCGFDQKRFTETSLAIAGDVGFDGLCWFCRDHGGPWQRDKERADRLPVEEAMRIAEQSYIDDIENGFHLLHIDPTKDPFCGETVPLGHVLDRTVELIAYVEKERVRRGIGEIAYEAGTEETNGGLTEPAAFEDFIRGLKERLTALGLPMPIFVVGQTGTLTRLTENVGHYDTKTASTLSAIVKKYGTGLKEHNGDYLASRILLEHPVIGVTAMNVAPEFGLVETEALFELAAFEDNFFPDSRSETARIITRHAIAGERWRKWMMGDKRTAPAEQIAANAEDAALVAKMCGHYTLHDPEVAAAVGRLNDNLARVGIDGTNYVVKRIRDSIDR